MPGVDILMQLGAAPWTTSDEARIQYVSQRARFDLVGVASRRALTGDIAGGNAEIKALLQNVPQARGWVVVNPTYPERSAEEMRRHLSSSKWLGATIHAGLSGESLASAATREVINAYRRYTRPLLVDIPNGAAVRDLEALAAEFTTLKFVAAGAGGDDWQDCMFAAKRYVNIFLEPLSGGSHRGKLETLLQVLGPNRVLFASNYPVSNPGAALGVLMDAKLTDGEKQNILTNNAVRLFGLTRDSEG